MRETLATLFGDTGAVVAQYVITLVVVLAVVALVVWVVRRYRGDRARATTRSRLPRLAVVDALAVDGKRRLVLVRRDNVEHLVLIGGPSDVVVEPSIVRQRVAPRAGQPAPSRPGATVAAAPPPPPPPVAEAPATPPPPPRVAAVRAPAEPDASAAIPFPPRRSPLRASERLSAWRRDPPPRAAAAAALDEAPAEPPPPERPAASARPEPVEAPEPVAARIEPPPSRFAPPVRPIADEIDDPEAPPEPAPVRPTPVALETDEAVEAPEAEVPEVEPETASGSEAEPAEPPRAASAFAPPARPRPAETASADEESGPGEDVDIAAAPPTAAMDDAPEEPAKAAGVSDLEKEMARLLDEISTSRQG